MLYMDYLPVHMARAPCIVGRVTADREGPINGVVWGRWCEQHQRTECTKHKRKGRGECHNIAIKGMDGCRFHVGLSLEVAKAQGDAKITAWNLTGGMPDVDYRMAVLGVLQMSWLRLASYSELLRRQVATEGDLAEGVDESDPQASGLIGYRYGAAGKDGRVYIQGEAVRSLVTLEATERDRVVKYAKTAHDMGISDRLTSLAEKWGDVVAGKISTILDALDLTPEQHAKVPKLITDHLSSIDVETISGADHGARTNGGRPQS